MQRALVAVVRPVLDAMAALSYLVQGRWDNFKAVGRAYRDFFRWHKTLAVKRREVWNTRCGSTSNKIYNGSIVLRYLFGCKKFDRLM